MKTEIVRIDRDNTDCEALSRAGEVIKSGGLVAFPTETVYGLGADALDAAAGEKIYAAKGRPSDNPLIVHIADYDSIERIVSLDKDDYCMAGLPDTLRELADRFWPGPLTIILKKTDAVPDRITGGLDTVAVRMPSDKIALGLIRASGGYIAAPSANLSGRPSTTKVSHVIEDLQDRVDMIIDGGDVDIGLESTILDLTGKRPMILRPGAITSDELSEILGDVVTDPAIMEHNDNDAPPKAPGMKYRHYAPRGELVIVTGDREHVREYINIHTAEDKAELLKTGVICVDEHVLDYRATSVKCTGKSSDMGSVAHRLYSILRDFDSEGIDRIYSESFEDTRLGQAVMNRLLKAAGHRVVDTNSI